MSTTSSPAVVPLGACVSQLLQSALAVPSNLTQNFLGPPHCARLLHGLLQNHLLYIKRVIKNTLLWKLVLQNRHGPC